MFTLVSIVFEKKKFVYYYWFTLSHFVWVFTNNLSVMPYHYILLYYTYHAWIRVVYLRDIEFTY